MTSWEKCPECDGKGWFNTASTSASVGILPATTIVDPCPRCSGLGELPSDGLVEAVAKGLWAEEQMSHDLNKRVPWSMTLKWERENFAVLARAALVAARVYER